MGYDLRNAQGTQHWGIDTWPELLGLAHEHGWQPEGTTLPVLTYDDGTPCAPCFGWDGSYFWNDHQIVSAGDARNLADGLERALPDAPPEMRTLMRELADYCRQGTFSIA
jgi:hypothetical protein